MTMEESIDELKIDIFLGWSERRLSDQNGAGVLGYGKQESD